MKFASVAAACLFFAMRHKSTSNEGTGYDVTRCSRPLSQIGPISAVVSARFLLTTSLKVVSCLCSETSNVAVGTYDIIEYFNQSTAEHSIDECLNQKFLKSAYFHRCNGLQCS